MNRRKILQNVEVLYTNYNHDRYRLPLKKWTLVSSCFITCHLLFVLLLIEYSWYLDQPGLPDQPGAVVVWVVGSLFRSAHSSPRLLFRKSRPSV